MGTVGIVDIGCGNVNSVVRAVQKKGCEVVLCESPQKLAHQERIIFPGVGSFFTASQRLHQGGWIEAVREEVLGKQKPILGICLGMQLLASEGEEGGWSQGLGLIKAKVSKHRAQKHSILLPHMGWNDVAHQGGILFDNIPSGECFYFVHSYEMVIEEVEVRQAICHYGVDFVAAFEKQHIFGTQFHPEKSQMMGLAVLDNFLRFQPC